MTFVQIMECRTSRVDDVNRLMGSWIDETRGRRTATHAMVGADRADRAHVVEIVEFSSYEQAVRDSGLPETGRVFRETAALCDEPPTFTDLDLVRDDRLDKAAVRRFFEQVALGHLGVIDELFAPDYRDHDHGNRVETRGTAALRDQARRWLKAFDFAFTVDSQLADADQVCTRWTWHGTHIGDFMGTPATGRPAEVTGTTVFRFQDGRIKEGWWHWDVLGLMRHLGIPPGDRGR
ncbi:ester cyclase [Yinghuangia seranimata]|uniref:ester cyclase n=1 Tax=Yinghuangia seranimata TaxID=408067 RepID=UPI00248D38E8|nr:ester cyclase [Yinghuangia seranimata]MDI2124785.1 ester cyclase [Yinghuangia seranimata]